MPDLEKRAIAIGRIAWQRLYHERTSLFYDFISDYAPTSRFKHLPTVEEIGRQQPNTNGWGTGMEDSMINGGVLLATVCDRHAATGDAALHDDAAKIFAGLRLCATKSSVEGFVPRSLSPWDGESYFVETSRDQLTHYAHGLWRYYHSPLSNEERRAEMREMIAALCRRLETMIVPENDFHFCKVNGDRGLVDKMWNVAPHEAPRLPMIYAVGWELTGDEHWKDLYRRYVCDALGQAATLDMARYQWCYALFQHQVSMEVLSSLENEAPNLKRAWREQMVRLADRVSAFLPRAQTYRAANVRKVDMDWRTRPGRNPGSSYGHIPEWPEAMLAEFRPVRELGEALLIKLLAPGVTLTEAEQAWLGFGLNEVDYETAFTYAMHYVPAAYWRLAANER